MLSESCGQWMIDHCLVKPGHGKLQKQHDEWKLKGLSKYNSFFMIKMKENIPLGSQTQDETTGLHRTKFNLSLHSDCHVDIKEKCKTETRDRQVGNATLR